MAATATYRRGFSLLELVIVSAVITILSAIAIPRYANSIANYRVSVIARRLAADIGMAQARARALSTSQAVVFDTVQNQYQLPQLPDVDRPGQLYTVSFNDPTISATLVSASFNGSATLTINGFGVPASGGTIQVRSGSALKTLTVNADSGVVTVQ
jgi:prepilin-type N-terminal cleavage/methylation domain-containing protein